MTRKTRTSRRAFRLLAVILAVLVIAVGLHAVLAIVLAAIGFLAVLIIRRATGGLVYNDGPRDRAGAAQAA